MLADQLKGEKELHEIDGKTMPSKSKGGREGRAMYVAEREKSRECSGGL